jgi:hypothetical protein
MKTLRFCQPQQEERVTREEKPAPVEVVAVWAVLFLPFTYEKKTSAKGKGDGHENMHFFIPSVLNSSLRPAFSAPNGAAHC